MMRIFITYILCILFISCESSKLEDSLKFAGSNRKELEKTLEYYQNDSLKQRAAIFLIENMPQHFSYERSHHSNSTSSMKKKYDSHVITSDYLISNIDFSFKIWKSCPWNKYYSFEDFCQCILPYRIEHEPLTNWKEKYYKDFSPVLDSLYKGTDPIKCCDVLVRYFSKIGFPNKNQAPTESISYDALFLKENMIGSCKESSSFLTYVLRSLGIPVNTDILYHADQLKLAHYWNSIKDTTGITIPFWLEENPEDVNIHKGLNDDNIRPKWKIYRYSYKEQLKQYPKQLKKHFLLSILKNPILEDVTSDYYGKVNLKVATKAPANMLFLARHFLLPIDVSKIDNGTAEFKNFNPHLLYFLYYYSKNKLRTVDYPFIFDGTSINYFIPDSNHIQKIEITRKTELKQRIKKHLDNAIGLRIEKVNSIPQKVGETLLEISDTIRSNYNKYIVKHTHNNVRYIKCTPLSDKYAEFAELSFYSDSLMLHEIPYTVINEDTTKTNRMHDNDPLSYYRNEEKGKALYLAFEKETRIQFIQFTPRNDDNFIRIGDEYELFYHVGKGWGWKTLGKQKATTNILYYEAPMNAVLWLKNSSRGAEEELFLYKNDKQIFFQ